MKNKITDPIPKAAHHRLYDMLGEHSSNETKLNTCRWFVEMMVQKFFLPYLPEETRTKQFMKMSTTKKIREIEKSKLFSQTLINVLDKITKLGHKGSHYSESNDDLKLFADKAVPACLSLFDLLLFDWFEKNSILETSNTAVILSTLFPAVRVSILARIIEEHIDRYNETIQKSIYHKHLIALVKYDDAKKARKILDEYLKTGILTETEYLYEKESIQHIHEGKQAGELPIPLTINDCKRNFDDVLKDLSKLDRAKNSGLIIIIDTLLEQIAPSDMANFEPNKIYNSAFQTTYAPRETVDGKSSYIII